MFSSLVLPPVKLDLSPSLSPYGRPPPPPPVCSRLFLPYSRGKQRRLLYCCSLLLGFLSSASHPRTYGGPNRLPGLGIASQPRNPVSAPINNVESLANQIDVAIPDDGISSDYFALDSDRLHAERFRFDQQEVHSDSDNPSWVDPLELKSKLAADEFWTSDESSDGLDSPRVQESSNLVRCENSESAPGFLENCEEVLVSENNRREVVNNGSGNGEKGGIVWWKLPIELIKFYIVKRRPIWPLPVAATMLGFFVLGRKLYKMRNKNRSLPFRLSIDDQNSSLFALRATHLSDAFSVVKRLPIMKPPLPSPGITLWPVLALR